MRILGDVAPYSREYQKYASRVRHQARGNPALEAEYERIAEQVRETKASTLEVAQRHFNAPVETLKGTVKSVTGAGIELAEYPGRTFHFSSVSSTMADLVAEEPDKSIRRGPSLAAHTYFSRAGGRPSEDRLQLYARQAYSVRASQGRARHRSSRRPCRGRDAGLLRSPGGQTVAVPAGRSLAA